MAVMPCLEPDPKDSKGWYHPGRPGRSGNLFGHVQNEARDSKSAKWQSLAAAYRLHLPSSSIIFHPIGSTAKHCSIMLPCHGAKATAFKVDQCNSQIKFQSKNIALYYSKISYNNQGHWTLHKFDQSTSAPGTRVTSASFESGSWSLGLGPLPQTQAPLSPMLSRHYGWLSSAAFAILRNSTFGK